MKNILVYSSTSKNLLNFYKKFLILNLKQLMFKYLIISMPQKKKFKTFLKSPHVNKRAKENFNLIIYKFKLHTSFTFSYLKTLRFNVPKNIHLKIIYSI
jgi:ribosomal protein S10